MKRISYLLSLLFFTAICVAQPPAKKSRFPARASGERSGTFLYTLSTSMETYTDLVNPVSLNNGEIWDEPEYSFSIGFPFEFLEEVVGGFQFYGSGSLMRTPTSDPQVDAYLFPFESDLIDRGAFGSVSLSPISYVVEGPIGNRIFKLEFNNAGSYIEMVENNTLDMFINFQMWLYEGSNIIQFRFGPSSIDDPDLFYDFLPGPLSGLTHYDEFNEVLSDIHFIGGSPSNPFLTTDVDNPFLIGTPPNGAVFTLSLALPLELDITSTNSNSYCEPNGTASVIATGGVPPYAYDWSNGEQTASISGLGAGAYTVTVTDNLGASATANVVITSPDPMLLEIDVTHETADGANDGTALVTVIDGQAPYAYEWSNGETTALIEDLAPGTYTVTVTDAGGCSEEAIAIINPFGCPELELESGVSHVSCFGNCDGAVAAEVVNGALPILYEWDNGDSGTFIDQLCPGFYTVTATDNNNCILIATFEVTEPAALVANAGSTNETLEGQNDGTAWVVAAGGTPPYAYNWNNGSTDSLIINLVPGTYSVIVTDVYNCAAYDTVVVEPGPCAILSGTVTDASCNGTCDGSIDVDPGFASYVWSSQGGSSVANLDSLCADVYSVTATDADGCVVETTFTVNQPNDLIATTGSTAESIAGGDGTAWVIPSGGTPPYTYQWSNGSTDSLITGLIAGVYFVTLTDSHGCIDVHGEEVLGFNCLFIQENEVQHVFCHDSCDGLIFVVPMGGVGPYEYAWSTGDTTNIVFDLCAGWYIVTVTDLGQGCSSFIAVEILQPDTFYFNADVVHETDSTQASIDITVNGGTAPYFYVWFGPNGFLSFNEDLVDIVPGEYIFNLFDSHDCSIIDTIEVLDLTVGLPVLPEGQVSIYPNPASSLIYIDTKLPGDYTVELISPIGERINTWQNVQQIDVSQLVSGLYVVMYKHADGYMIRKIMIQ